VIKGGFKKKSFTHGAGVKPGERGKKQEGEEVRVLF